MATKRRVIVRVDPPVTVNDPNAPAALTAVTTTQWKVDWTMAATTDIVGVRAFNVVLTTAAGNPRNSGDVVKSRTVWDPAARSYTFADMQSGTYIAWVQAVVDGADSDWVSSSGITITDDLVPTLRSSDDRNSAQLTEDFRSAVLPAGMAVLNSIYDLTTTRGELAMQQSGGAAISFTWALPTWMAAQVPPVDNVRDSTAVANAGARIVVKLKIDVTAAYSSDTPATVTFFGGVVGVGTEVIPIPVVNDGKYHIYYIPVGRVAFGGSPTVQVTVPLTAGSVARCDAVAVAWGNFDSSLDNNVDHGIVSRNNFGKDTGGDYFLLKSIRQPGDPTGSQLIIDQNGVFFFRNADGGVLETAYKLGRRVDLGPVNNLGGIIWGSGTVFGVPNTVRPTLPQPKVLNKIRVIMEPRGATIADTTGGSVVRQYVEINDVGIEGCSFAACQFFGGTIGNYSAFGPWSQTVEAKSSLSLDADHALGTTNASDAWYRSSNDLPSLIDGTIYFRTVVWIAVTMPTRKKADGRPYYCDLSFQVHRGWGNVDGPNNKYILSGGFSGRTYVARTYTDGGSYRFPIWFSNVAYFTGGPGGGFREATKYDMNNIKVDWFAQSLEPNALAGSDPSSVAVDHVEWDYLAGGTKSALSGESYILTYLEEY